MTKSFDREININDGKPTKLDEGDLDVYREDSATEDDYQLVTPWTISVAR